MCITFDNDNTASLVCAVTIRGHAFVFSAVLGFTVDDLHADDTVRTGYVVFQSGEFLAVLVPLDSGLRLAAQAAQQLARVAGLHDSRSQKEGEVGRGLFGLDPEVVG